MAVPTPSQFRAARALLDWSLAEAAEAARVSVVTIQTAEGRTPGRQVDGAGPGIQAAFEARGVVFTEDGDGAGVKLRHG